MLKLRRNICSKPSSRHLIDRISNKRNPNIIRFNFKFLFYLIIFFSLFRSSNGCKCLTSRGQSWIWLHAKLHIETKSRLTWNGSRLTWNVSWLNLYSSLTEQISKLTQIPNKEPLYIKTTPCFLRKSWEASLIKCLSSTFNPLLSLNPQHSATYCSGLQNFFLASSFLLVQHLHLIHKHNKTHI